ncbi:OmpA family protein [Flavobacterium chungnamense]|uniref:OmpA-like domain-containing protein n=1 Tax=Flavobacterium chungnamense TaxID=706182 RepID=A0ABP7ULI1_9FLAO
MKKTLLFLTLLSSILLYSQKKIKEKDSTQTAFNKWAVQISAGQLKGISPYADGYYSSNPGTFFGSIDVNSFSIAGRYSFSPIFGVKVGLQYEELRELTKNSLPFKMQQIGVSIQGVTNLNRLFNIENELNRFGILLHGGLKIDQMKSKTANTLTNSNFNKKELNGGLVFGITPQFRISNRIAIFGDVTVQNSFRQHFNWDGSYSDLSSNNMKGQSLVSSIGLSISIGKNKIHGDWSIIKPKEIKKIEVLNNRIEEMETLMNDTDKDGIADYLDQENNSVAGVAVDSRGKMVDLNKNGVPDEIERYISTKVEKEKSSEDLNKSTLQTLIDDEYIAVFFETNKTIPTNVSSEGLNFIRTYLKTNPNESVYVIGHADEIGTEEKNKKLSEDRAKATREILIKSGIDGKRLIILAEGEDNSVDKGSKKSRDLVRKVTFKIIK